jgi:hypothetical protein
VRYDRDFPAVLVGYSVRDLKGQMVVGGLCSNEGVTLPPASAGEVYVYEVESVNRLLPGTYTISFGVETPVSLNRQHVFVDVLEHCAVFRSREPVQAENLFYAMVYVPAGYRYVRAAGGAVAAVEVADASR